MALGAAFIAAALATAGCSQAPATKAAVSGAPAGSQAKPMMMSTKDTSPGIDPCYGCSGKGTPPVVEGKATIENGKQVVRVKIVNGYYSTNRITAQAGMPIKVVFTGKAKDCIGKPKFGSLGKQIDIRQTGRGTIDLGTLSPGNYRFTCGMGGTPGSISVQ